MKATRKAPIEEVLTTLEAIIEQASTQKLLDILIDESVRTTARRPIMMQFDPSSGWVSTCDKAFRLLLILLSYLCSSWHARFGEGGKGQFSLRHGFPAFEM